MLDKADCSRGANESMLRHHLVKWLLPKISHDKCWQSSKVSLWTLFGLKAGAAIVLHSMDAPPNLKRGWEAEHMLRACEVLGSQHCMSTRTHKQNHHLPQQSWFSVSTKGMEVSEGQQ